MRTRHSSHSSRCSRLLGLAVLVGGTFSQPAAAQSEKTATPGDKEADPSARLDAAKIAFRRGAALLEAEDHERALELFLESRSLYPSVQNTKNAAYCLYRLDRLDEALELYESLLTDFGTELGEDARGSLGPRMQELRRKLGSIDVAANVEGVVVIDGRVRGRLPLLTPIRVTPGRHVVRVLKDGFEPSETPVTVKVGETAPLDIKLNPLARAGRLRVETSGAPGAEVFVDGAPVGKTPWEGTLSAGPHVAWVRREDEGSAPFALVVVDGRQITERAVLLPLGSEMRVEVTPRAAEILVDGVRVGQGIWTGRLPIGAHRIESAEEGYLPSERSVTVKDRRSDPVVLRLEPDASHPRWQEARRGSVFLEAHLGRPLATSFESSAEAACPGGLCSLPFGIDAGARGGYAFAFGLSIEIGGGYFNLHRTERRERTTTFGPEANPTTVSYQFTDSMVIAGPYGTAGLGYRLGLDGTFSLGARLHAGAVGVTAQDRLQGQATSGRERAPVNVEHAGEPVRAASFFLAPELYLRADLRWFHVAVGFSGTFFLSDGPRYAHGEAVIPRAGAECATYPAPLRCAPGDNALSGERAYGRFMLWTPSITVGYTL